MDLVKDKSFCSWLLEGADNLRVIFIELLYTQINMTDMNHPN